jgi:hypothetical protein
VEFTREVTSAGQDPGESILGANQARIAWRPAPSLSVLFAADEVACGQTASARQGQEYDTYVFAQTPRLTADKHNAAISVLERATLKGCGPRPVRWTISWNAVSVLPQIPRDLEGFAASPTHAPTDTAFRRAASSVCATVNADLAPLAKQARAADSALARATPPDSAGAHAASQLATLAAQIPRVALRDFTDPAQPPAGSLDTLWLRYVARERTDLYNQWAGVIAIIAQMHAYADYERTGSTVALQRALAQETLANADTTYVHTLDHNLTGLQHRLALPATCTTTTHTIAPA